VTGSFEAVKNTEPYERWGILGLAGIAFRVATVFCENTAQKFAGARSPFMVSKAIRRFDYNN
jgi:hypothetical protein